MPPTSAPGPGPAAHGTRLPRLAPPGSYDDADAAAPGARRVPDQAARAERGADLTPRPHLTELRLSAYAGHRATVLRLGPVTLLTGPSGSGKSTALAACAALAALGNGATLAEAFPEPHAAVPESARPDPQRRRGFRIGCVSDGPAGPVRLDLAVQAEPELRVVGERLSGGDGVVHLETALRDPARRSVQAAWHTAGTTTVTRAPFPDDLLGTTLLPLRVAGRTKEQRRVLAAAEQTVLALRTLYPCAPDPAAMRPPAAAGDGLLRGDCANLAEVLHRAERECRTRYGFLEAAVREGCAGAVDGLATSLLPDGGIVARLLRPDGPGTPLAHLGAGELRHLALALVLLTGPGVLDLDPASEVPGALQTLTVLADDFDLHLDARQSTLLLDLAARMAVRGHIRLLGALSRPPLPTEAPAGVRLVELGAEVRGTPER
ncbi:biotin transporter BioY [Streptomyces sp. SPB074]|uniref:biotin transporter BioY n=1 Tax=Streptomyces sp. (strain SPB074) TaxID=465543 RepID=UPI0001D1E363|nr:biotin transporter BioY [Streptomyces sp. SPB074]EFG64503.1 BldA-regulated nucleotide binding protein [Streptomyces sp. SPB074]